MKYLFPVFSTIISAALVFFFMFRSINNQKEQFQIEKLEFAKQCIENRFEEYKVRIENQLTAFSQAVTSNRIFSLRLLVENDRSSIDITELASRYLKPMGFSVLDIADSEEVILSSGHFPANAGNRLGSNTDKLSLDPSIVDEFVMGSSKMILKAKKEFKIADIPFLAVGGIEVNEGFLNNLIPCDGVKVILKRENEYYGIPDIHSVSEIKEKKIIINDNEYFAAQFELPYVGEEDKSPVLIVILEQ